MTEVEIKQAAERYSSTLKGSMNQYVAYDAFIAGAEANAPKWISVTEGNKKDGKAYLVRLEWPQGRRQVKIFNWSDRCECFDSFEEHLVTHYQDIPDSDIPSPPNEQP